MRGRSAVAVVAAAVLASCASTGFLMARPTVTSYGYTFPAKDSTAAVEVFESASPKRPYMEIGRIQIDDTNRNWNMRQILIAARKLGADAVILVGQTGAMATAIPVGTSSVAVAENYGLSAIAIRYREP